jgi:hypothetical protein
MEAYIEEVPSGGHRVVALHRMGLSKKHDMIVAFLGKSINHYREYFLKELSRIVLVCPSCEGETHCHGWYLRTIKGESEGIRILRVRCRQCGKTHAVIPDFLSPYKHYAQTVQEAVLGQVVENGTAVERIEACVTAEGGVELCFPAMDTMRRWIHRYRKRERQYIGAVAGFLERCGRAVGEWSKGFRCFRHLVELAQQLEDVSVKGSCLLGQMNILLAISLPGLWI